VLATGKLGVGKMGNFGNNNSPAGGRLSLLNQEPVEKKRKKRVRITDWKMKKGNFDGINQR